MFILLIIILFVNFSNSCHPVCSFTYNNISFPAHRHHHHHSCNNDPVPMCHLEIIGNNTYFAKCKPKCSIPNCQTQCQQLDPALCHVKCEPPSCRTICPKDQCETEGCPMCENVCDQPICKVKCIRPKHNCTNLCEAPLCSWFCKKPNVCNPKFNIVCDHLPHGYTVPKTYPQPIVELNCEKPSCSSNITTLYDHHC